MNKIQNFLLNGCSNNNDGFSNNNNTKKKNKKKILCLHGGGQECCGLPIPSATKLNSFEYMLKDFTNDLKDDFEFIFTQSPVENNVWYKDKPGGKESTQETDEKWADDSVNYLDNLVMNTGSVDSIIAYSQGVPMSLVLLSKRNYTPPIKLILLNGYLPKTHKGLMELIESNSKFSNKTLIFLGKEDTNFYDLGLELENKFKDPEVLKSDKAGHGPPDKNDKTYSQIIDFIKSDC